MVEVWPYMERSRGIAVFQLFGRLAGFFTTFVNPIGLENIAWKWLIVYVAWLTYEVVFVWFLFPETANRTLEELAFREYCLWSWRLRWRLICTQYSKARRRTSGRVRRWRRLLLRGRRTLLVRGRFEGLTRRFGQLQRLLRLVCVFLPQSEDLRKYMWWLYRSMKAT